MPTGLGQVKSPESMQKINLLYVITKLELGGAQTQLLTLLHNLDRTRYNLFLFTAREGLLSDEVSRVNGLTLHRSKYLERAISPLKDILALFEIFNYIKMHKIDIVHTHSSKAGVVGRWAAALSGAKAVFHTVHGWSFNDFQPAVMRWIFIGLERFNARFTRKIIVISESDRKKGLENRIGSKGHYILIRYGIDKSPLMIKDPTIRAELGIGGGDLVVGTISCFKPQKALGDFLELACLIRNTLPQTRFLMVGDGALRRQLEEKISNRGLGGNVILTGWRRDISRVLSAMDIFVLTSLWEGLPISAIEAMAAGVPVVATHTGGIGEIVEEGKTGALAPCQDITSMLEKVLPLLRDETLRKRAGQQARESVRDRFNVADMIRESDALYQREFQKNRMSHGR